MTGAQLLRGLFEGIQKYQPAELKQFLSEHGDIADLMQKAKLTADDVLKQLDENEFWAMLNKKPWLLKFASTDEEARVYRLETVVRMCGGENMGYFNNEITRQGIKFIVELFVWFYHAKQFANTKLTFPCSFGALSTGANGNSPDSKTAFLTTRHYDHPCGQRWTREVQRHIDDYCTQNGITEEEMCTEPWFDPRQSHAIADAIGIPYGIYEILVTYHRGSTAVNPQKRSV